MDYDFVAIVLIVVTPIGQRAREREREREIHRWDRVQLFCLHLWIFCPVGDSIVLQCVAHTEHEKGTLLGILMTTNI